MSECALWYARYHSIYVELYESEEHAAETAVWMEVDGDAAVQGVQFPDGRYIDRGSWIAYKNAYETYVQSLCDSYDSDSEPPPAMREVRTPWDDKRVSILADLPNWVGR